MYQKLFSFSVIVFLFFLFTPLIILANPDIPQQQRYGIYFIPDQPGWNYVQEESMEDFFVFRNDVSNTTIKLIKEPFICESKKTYNRAILRIIQDKYSKQVYMEKSKKAAQYPCLGENSCQMLIMLSKPSDKRTLILTPLVDHKLFQIEISGDTNFKVPPTAAISFISKISIEPEEEILADNTNQQPPIIKYNENTPATPVKNEVKSEPKYKTHKSRSITKNNPATKKTPKLNNIPLAAPVKIDKGNIPNVKFSATDPCASSGKEDDGLPWESKQNTNKIDLPENVDAVIPPAIPDIKNLSKASYNSAVSAAFEGMRLVYGPMPDDEAKKFEKIWAPLFDYPTQSIINYLNKLNPLISQFLASREAYIRTINDIQMVLLDAGTAIEMDEQQAWEAAMAESEMYSSVLPHLDAAMKSITKQIESLGNPPNPVDAKCEARKRYKKFFKPSDPEGCWAGYQHNIAISSDDFGSVYEPYYIYIFKVNANGTEKYYSIDVCVDCNLGLTEQKGNCSFGGFGDEFIRKNLMNVQNYAGKYVDGSYKGQLSQYVQKFDYPAIPEFSETSNQKLLGIIKKDKELNKNWAQWESTVKKMIKSKSVAQTFYKTALEWTDENRWNDFDYPDDSWMCPDEVLVAFSSAMGGGKVTKKKSKTTDNSKPLSDNSDKKQNENDQMDQDKKDAIAFHSEMINVIKHQLEREVSESSDLRKKLYQSKNKKEAAEHLRRLKELDLRIIGIQSNIQAEQDLVASYKSGQLVHTRTVFDEYARNKFIQDTRIQAARMDATRHIAERIDRQIELLPWQEQAKAREEARKIINSKTIASGDLEKAKRLVNAFNNKIQGYAEYDGAKAKEAEIDAQQNEFYAQTTIMAAGALFVGFGSAALADAYGAEAAATIYGPQVLGSIWGGTTGFIAGGPKEGLTQAVSWASPKGFAAMQFLEGYENAGYQEDATTAERIWEGAKQAGSAYFIGKIFEMGVGMITKGSLIALGEESRLFKPVLKSPSQRSKQVLDAMRTSNKLLEAKDAMKSFQTLESELNMLKQNPGVNTQKIAQLEKELQQLSASMNADYYAKWLFKYKASPDLRRQFDLRVQENYSEMIPGMVERLEAKGYNMNGIEFKQFRNASSGGSSSMDLDLGPVVKGTMNEPGIKMFKSKMVVKKDGSLASMEQFMNDSQAAMNAEYKQLTGMSAPASDMNLVTSAHPEAFSTPKLLKHDVDFSNFTAEEIGSIGKVLNVKMEGINKNQMLTNTTKMQAKCRESAKEIENMLLRKLKQDIKKAPAGSSQQKQIQADINYWEDMLKRFKKAGMEETNPMEIIKMNHEIMQETGGRDITGVINDLKAAFGK